jgi:hypothetical protein
MTRPQGARARLRQSDSAAASVRTRSLFARRFGHHRATSLRRKALCKPSLTLHELRPVTGRRPLDATSSPRTPMRRGRRMGSEPLVQRTRDSDNV